MKTLAEFSDDELLYKLQSGDNDAFKVIYHRYWAIMYQHAIRMIGDYDEAKDIVQDVFANLYQKCTSIHIKTSLSGYLYSAIRNKILDAVAKEKVKKNYLASLDDFVELGNYQPDHLIRHKQLARLIEREVSLLPAKMREVFLMSRNQDKSYKEIADELSVSDHTVKKQISNALKILRTKLETSTAVLISLISFLLSDR